MPFSAIWIHQEIVILNEVSQSRINIIYHLFVEFEKKNDTNELIYETENQKHRK